MWIVSTSDPEHPGKMVARAYMAEHQGGTCLPGALIAETLDELRTQIPAGLTRRDRTSMLPPNAIETWD